jgi:hypothetical protein
LRNRRCDSTSSVVVGLLEDTYEREPRAFTAGSSRLALSSRIEDFG